MTKKLALWIVGIAGTGLLSYLIWLGTVLIDIQQNNAVQKYVDSEQSESITINSNSLSRLSVEMAEKMTNAYSYIDKRDNAVIIWMQKINSQLQKINNTLHFPVDYNGINARNYLYNDTLTTNKYDSNN